MSPYEDGFHAGMRTEHYEGVTRQPECPYSEDEKELYREWWDGFGDATDWLCVGQYLDYDEDGNVVETR